jgi:RNA polymerase sigma-70 factor (ECF subfamily)
MRNDAVASAVGAATFEGAILPHLDSAYNMARWLVGDPTLAEDVVQDAAIRAIRYFGSFRGDNARAWLLQIVRNVAHEARATRERHAADSLSDVGPADGDVAALLQIRDPADDPEAALRRQEDQSRLGAALAALPTELRECLVLRELEELSYKEIAQVTGVPVGTVMSRLWRARRNLAGAEGEPCP